MRARKIIADDEALQVDEHHKKISKMLTKTASKKFQLSIFKLNAGFDSLNLKMWFK